MKGLLFALVLSVLLVAGAFVLRQLHDPSVPEDVQNVAVVDGTQIIAIGAKGGFSPEHSVAKAGVPTVLKFVTSGTYDCSASVRIPSKDISVVLPATGEKEINIGTPEVSTLVGTCGMGMFPFEIEFRS